MPSKRRISLSTAADLLGKWNSSAKKLKPSENLENEDLNTKVSTFNDEDSQQGLVVGTEVGPSENIQENVVASPDCGQRKGGVVAGIQTVLSPVLEENSVRQTQLGSKEKQTKIQETNADLIPSDSVLATKVSPTSQTAENKKPSQPDQQQSQQFALQYEDQQQLQQQATILTPQQSIGKENQNRENLIHHTNIQQTKPDAEVNLQQQNESIGRPVTRSRSTPQSTPQTSNTDAKQTPKSYNTRSSHRSRQNGTKATPERESLGKSNSRKSIGDKEKRVQENSVKSTRENAVTPGEKREKNGAVVEGASSRQKLWSQGIENCQSLQQSYDDDDNEELKENDLRNQSVKNVNGEEKKKIVDMQELVGEVQDVGQYQVQQQKQTEQDAWQDEQMSAQQQQQQRNESISTAQALDATEEQEQEQEQKATDLVNCEEQSHDKRVSSQSQQYQSPDKNMDQESNLVSQMDEDEQVQNANNSEETDEAQFQTPTHSHDTKKKPTLTSSQPSRQRVLRSRSKTKEEKPQEILNRSELFSPSTNVNRTFQSRSQFPTPVSGKPASSGRRTRSASKILEKQRDFNLNLNLNIERQVQNADQMQRNEEGNNIKQFSTEQFQQSPKQIQINQNININQNQNYQEAQCMEQDDQEITKVNSFQQQKQQQQNIQNNEQNEIGNISNDAEIDMSPVQLFADLRQQEDMEMQNANQYERAFFDSIQKRTQNDQNRRESLDQNESDENQAKQQVALDEGQSPQNTPEKIGVQNVYQTDTHQVPDIDVHSSAKNQNQKGKYTYNYENQKKGQELECKKFGNQLCVDNEQKQVQSPLVMDTNKSVQKQAEIHPSNTDADNRNIEDQQQQQQQFQKQAENLPSNTDVGNHNIEDQQQQQLMQKNDLNYLQQSRHNTPSIYTYQNETKANYVSKQESIRNVQYSQKSVNVNSNEKQSSHVFAPLSQHDNQAQNVNDQNTPNYVQKTVNNFMSGQLSQTVTGHNTPLQNHQILSNQGQNKLIDEQSLSNLRPATIEDETKIHETNLTPVMRQVSLDCQVQLQQQQSLRTESLNPQKVNSTITSAEVLKAFSSQKQRTDSNVRKVLVSASPCAHFEFEVGDSKKVMNFTPVPVKVEETPASKERQANEADPSGHATVLSSKSDRLLRSQKSLGRILENDVGTPMNVDEDVNHVLETIGWNSQSAKGNVGQGYQETATMLQANASAAEMSLPVVFTPSTENVQDDFRDEYRRTSMFGPMYKEENELLCKKILELEKKVWDYYQWGQKLAEQVDENVGLKTQLQAEAEELRQKVTNLERSSMEQQQSFVEQEAQYKNGQEQLQTQLSCSIQRVQQLEAQVSDLKHMLDAKELVVQDVQEKIGVLHSDKREVQSKLEQTQELLKEKESKLDKYRTLIYQFKEENNKFDNRHQLEKQKIQQLSAEVERCKQNIVTLQYTLKNNGIQPPLLK